MSEYRKRSAFALAVLLFVGAHAPARAQAQKEPHEEYAKQIKTAEVIGALGNDLFGDQVNFYTGSTSFSVIDVSLPGNHALPVEIRRTFTVDARDGLFSQGLFADWELDIPHLYGTFARKTLSSEVGWQVSTSTPNARCSVSDAYDARPPEAAAAGPVGTYFEADEYWFGNSLHVPGGGDQEMLVVAPENPNKPTGGPYYWMTSGNWFFSCLASTANGISGQAFLARAPDGTTYRFDYFVKRTAPSVKRSNYSAMAAVSVGSTSSTDGQLAPALVSDQSILNRQVVRILPSRVTDRFGNWVDYIYDTTVVGQLNRISASDGRQIDLTYNSIGKIATVTSGARTWTYTYVSGTGGGTGLTTVTLPDSSRWSYDLAALRTIYLSYFSDTTTCESPGERSGAGGTGTMTHPSGTVGRFTINWVRHGRSYVPKSCVQGSGGRIRYSVIPQTFDTPSLTSKQISGPGITTENWSYQYSTATGSWLANCPTPASCARTKTVTVTGPSDWQRYTFGTKVFEDEGKMLKSERGGSASSILAVDETTYQTNSAGQLYPSILGRSPNGRGDGMSQYVLPEKKRVTTQQGRKFVWEVPSTCGPNGTAGTSLCFDSFARPIRVAKSSAPTP